MPIYEYECDTCGVRFERMQRITDEPLQECPECCGHVHRVLHPVGIIFKGPGFYVTDNRGKSPTALPGESRSNGDKTPKAETAETKSEPAKTESKSETKSE